MTAAELLKHYLPAYRALQKGGDVKVLISIAAQGDELLGIREHRSQGFTPGFFQLWEKAGIIRLVGHLPQITPKGMKLLRCETTAQAVALRDHERSLPKRLRMSFDTYLTLLFIAAAEGEMLYNEALKKAGCRDNEINRQTVRYFEDLNYVTIRREPGTRHGYRYFMTITPHGLQSLRVSASPVSKSRPVS